MKPKRTSFAPPTFHFLIVDDDQETWAPRLERSFREYLEPWGFFRCGLFRCEVHRCRSEASFRRLGEELLEQGHLVYAAVDLILPRRDCDEIPDRTLWKTLIPWCLRLLEKPAGRHGRFDFCVMSAHDATLEGLFADRDRGEQLLIKGVKKINKLEIDDTPEGEGKLAGLWDDVRNFVLGEIGCCCLPEGSEEQSRSTVIWFGDDLKLSELRSQADRIATQRGGGPYLIFSDASGYEEDWFRLVCRLRGTPLRQSRILSLATVQPHHNPDWDRVLAEPPAALLLTHIDRAVENRCDLLASFERHGFFERVRERGTLVFLQFPHFGRGQSLALSLDKEEIDILDVCLQQIGAGKLSQLDAGIELTKNSHVLGFPSFDELKAVGVVDQSIAFEVDQCQRFPTGARVLGLDPELIAVLAEIPWSQHGGLFQLRSAIRYAFQRATANGNGTPLVDSQHFGNETVRQAFNSSVGFVIRGRRLFDLLSRQRSRTRAGDAAQAMLAGLEEVFELYDGLDRLVNLHRELELRKESTTSIDFPLEHFEALRRARDFLDLVFGAPDHLLERIQSFRDLIAKPWLRGRAKDFYPSLRERANWRELVEHMRFLWPYNTFALPRSVSDYLEHSRVVAELHPDFPTILQRYPRLAEAWRLLEERQTALRQKLQERETQRWVAECYVRESDAQPVCALLTAEITHTNDRLRTYEHTLRSLLFFNAYLAVCEDHYRFAQRLKPRSIREMLSKPELGYSVGLIGRYLRVLGESDTLENSVFRHWRDDWPARSKQRDAIRLVERIAVWLRDNDIQRQGHQDLIDRLCTLEEDEGHCPVADLLDLLLLIRNFTVKMPVEGFWADKGEEVWDLLRRFVTAVSHPHIRLGHAGADGNLDLWSRQGIEKAAITATANGSKTAAPARLSVLIGRDYRALFPIDEVVRLNPEDGSLWGAYSAGEDWIDLAYLGEGVPRVKPGPDRGWLQSTQEFRISELWRRVNGI